VLLSYDYAIRRDPFLVETNLALRKEESVNLSPEERNGDQTRIYEYLFVYKIFV